MDEEAINKIKDCVSIAKRIVETEDGEFKKDIFKIVLQNLINGSISIKNEPTPQMVSRITTSEEVNSDDPITNLALSCQLSADQIRNVFEYNQDKFVLLKHPNEKMEMQNQIIATQCILTAWKKGMNAEWVNASEILAALENRGIGTNHLSKNLGTIPKLIKKIGSGKGMKYGLTTTGWQEGVELLKKLATN